jgi:peptide/nickel transport system substrate-binding protein
LRLRRRLKRTQKKVETAQNQAADHLDKHVVRRWQKFADVRRFVFGWLALISLLFIGVYAQTQALTQYYQTTQPAPGGTYVEGVIGTINNLNPIFASSPADRVATQLIFSRLLTYNTENQLVGDLAINWSLNEDQTVYTVNLKEEVTWHDGDGFDANDVVFTFETIQHPDTGSPLNRSWRNITVEAVDDFTVTFTLPNPFTPFIHSLTTVGILPSHLLGEVLPKEMRSHPFNTEPRAGTGPFTFDNISLEEDRLGQIQLTRYSSYHNTPAHLNEFIIQSFTDEEQLISALQDGIITGAAGLRVQDLGALEDMNGVTISDPQLFNNVLVFFNTSEPELEERAMRQALTQSTNTTKMLEVLQGRYALSDGPLLRDQLGYDETKTQLGFDAAAADDKLNELGWTISDDGIRRNEAGEQLTFELISQNSDEYQIVAEEIQRQWAERGIILQLTFVEPDDLQQTHIVPHNYQLLLLGINQGIDPDVFVYWHSSEARVGGFNLSEIQDTNIDLALESGRTRNDTDLRAAKYEAFQARWRSLAPAVALYRPSFIYVQRGQDLNTEIAPSFVEPLDRFRSITSWTVNTVTVNQET